MHRLARPRGAVGRASAGPVFQRRPHLRHLRRRRRNPAPDNRALDPQLHRPRFTVSGMNDSDCNMLEQADRVFVDPDRYLDLDSWHRTAAWLRRNDPVHRVEVDGFDPFYALTRHADII